ncbi:protein-glutamate methylesterase/protein-glutamine glutaminase [Agarilytica rhodophyticola]|uniref:protein-glutamate methylesterase/protein-glutamine glutaminase n=1 Tax=Agarilytica rhodophyticola TaxID=1737490 RepID=UPI000B3443D3|nr:chemotaxis response regulator protein-glutamate methylesterase [Agarilytica rhodophyticola]
MPYSVLVVDDSHFFQMRLKDIINEHKDLNVVGVATNGQEAIDMTAKLKPDVISMDYEMPFLDGISAVKAIMAEIPTPIIMFSSMTYEGAKITLDALDAGAVDFMNKNFAEVSSNSAIFKKKFHEKLIVFAQRGYKKSPSRSSSFITAPRTPPLVDTSTRSIVRNDSKRLKGKIKLIAIGASTGGPVAVADIVTGLKGKVSIPILIIQHMPENFTRAFAERLDRSTPLTVKEAENGDMLKKGHVLVAPGGKQLMVDRSGNSIKIVAGDNRVNYKPCVDITFASAAIAYGSAVLGIVLTGMGSDGCEGARLLKDKGSTIWSQDEDSCVVYGMPAAVAKSNISSCILPLKDIAQKIVDSV